MKKIISTTLLLFLVLPIVAQIKGKVTNTKGAVIPFVSITIDQTYIGTSTNESGEYLLNYNKPGKFTIIAKNIGYKTVKISKETTAFPVTINVVLDEEDFTIESVVVKATENPANKIIRNAITARKKNTLKTDKFSADFYSKGIFKVKDIPKKFMGVEIGDMGGNLDSLGNGIIYQSETVSKIKFEKPNNLTEEILASKVAGNDNGFSFNTALDTNYDFYQNTIDFNIPMISPIASNALSYYKYKLESYFYDDNKNLINKIKVIAKRDKEPVFEGYIYIVEDTWAIYAIDLDVKGYRSQNEFLENLKLVQNFNYNSNNGLWAKTLQTLDFKAGFFGMKFNGKFIHVFSNYEFVEKFDKKTFNNEVVKFAEKANKKEDSYWTENRPVPLTEEETINYVKKDSVYKVRNSEVYLDSIDKKKNQFKAIDLITGYNYKNSFKKYNFNYDGLFNLASGGFNTIQGYYLSTGFSFNKYNPDNGSRFRISTNFQYGFTDKRVRPTLSIYRKFNNTNDFYIRLNAGVKVQEFNPSEPTSGIINTVASLFFKDNYFKAYNKEFASVFTGREIVNGISGYFGLSYENRKPLFNNTEFSIIKKDKLYLSNNPLDPNSDLFSAITPHNITKISVGANFSFNQKYISRPNSKINLSDNRFPKIGIAYTKAIASNIKNYQFDLLSMNLDYSKQLGNKGNIDVYLKAAKFFNADNISFADYNHFNGNQTHFLYGSQENSFKLLPYYQLSTNTQFFETHINYKDNGFLLNKIPLINKLGWNFVAGFHQANIAHKKPYTEVSVGLDRVGFGKFKIFRIEYVRNYQGGFISDGLMFGFGL